MTLEDFLAQLDATAVSVCSDGACSGNPGPGGWGVVLVQSGRSAEISDGESQTTNNRMELMAVIQALTVLPDPIPVTITTDSQYVQKGMEQWLAGWKKKGWKTAANQPVKNKDLWTQLDDLCQRKKVTWTWVRGHAGHPGNERADTLARKEIAKVMMLG